MLCEECGKNQAEVLVTTVVNGQSATRHLCRACLKKYQAGDLQAVLAAILSAMAGKLQEADEETPDIVCPKCGETYAEFQKTGMLGCAECYQAFRPQLTPMITKLQGRSQHAGRRPPVNEEEQARMDRMEELRARMEAAVAVENFEEAAKLRDELRAMTPAKEEKS
jgi:protein arginine kinase activator